MIERSSVLLNEMKPADIFRLTLRRPAVSDKAALPVTWQRSAARMTRDVLAALGAGVVIGAIGWEFLEQKTRGYWT